MQILVLGMHRSGTSTVARLLNLMGVYFGPEGVEMPATRANVKGFWERTDVNRACVELLRSAGCGWHRLSQFTLDKIPAQSLEEFRSTAEKIILGLDAHRPWFLKEPRFCILASAWLELLETPLCLFVHRSPVQIARSLQARDGFDIPFGLALWERYLVSAINATRGRQCLHVQYESLLKDSFATVTTLKCQLEEICQCELRLPTKKEITSFIDPNLNHATADDEISETLLSDAQQQLWKGIRSGLVVEGPLTFSPEAQIHLLQHDRLCERAEEEARAARLTEKIREARQETSERDKEIAFLKAKNERTEETNKISKQLHALLASAMETVRRAAKADTAKEIQIVQLRETQSRALAELNDKRDELAAQSRELAETETQLAVARGKLDDVWALFGQKQIENLKFRRMIRHLRKALSKFESHFVRLQESRSFHFFVYTARRLGLVSRTPRRQVELINKQLSDNRKLLEKVDATLGKTVEAAPDLLLLKPAQKPQGDAEAVPLNPVPSPAAQSINGEEPRSLDNVPARETPSMATTSPVVDAHDSEPWYLRQQSALINQVALPPPVASEDMPAVCFIVLHKSGEEHLRKLFVSFLSYHAPTSAEFIIVLHDCHDASRDVLSSFAQRLKIEVLDFNENHSFAYSNNRAVERTDAEYVIFLNNDIVFQAEVITELLRLLQNPRTGLAGLRLHFPEDDQKHPAGLQHGGVKFRPDPTHFFYRPWNIGVHIGNFETPPVAEKFPAVTAALLACRRADFLAAGGFCEAYFYGYEDVDLCLTFKRCLGLQSVSANYVSAVHNESTTGKLDTNECVRARRLNNITNLIRRQGWFLRRQWQLDKFAGRLFYSDCPLTIAFAVTEASAGTAAGDYFSALELGEACRIEFGWKVSYLSRKDDWYNLKDIDVLIVMLDPYELSAIRDAKPDLVKVAWLRNWFERWVSRPDFEQYDLFLCSSDKAARWLRETQRKPAWIFPLATNPERFAGGQFDTRLASDYCFTGSNWKLEREIESAVQPEKLDGYKFAIFGRGWDSHPSLRAYDQGFLPYSEMPKVYASTRIVVDDANHVTKTWGSVNSRVFDALAAGALVITNGAAGASEIFDGELPVYSSPAELHALLRRYLHNEPERQLLVDKLRKRVLLTHTYRRRARTLKKTLLHRARHNYRIAIKIGAPTRSQVQHWGDYHFALSLGRCFAEEGHSFRIDCIDEWERPECFGDDVVIALRGLSRYRPRQGQINLIWNISHPDKIDDEEYEEFDHIFVASESYATELALRLKTPVTPLLQCTDPFVFYPDPNPAVPAEELLFVGNSRKQYREVVRLAVEAEVPLAVYGTYWSMFIPARYIRGEYVENSVLRQHYSRCKILLNDHWPSMRDHGFISNRLFDAAAAGAFVLSDSIKGATAIFGDDFVSYRDAAEFQRIVEYYFSHPQERQVRAQRMRCRILAAHTFAHRALEIEARIRLLDQNKRSAQVLLGKSASQILA